MQEKFEVERIVCGPRIFDGAYLIKWAGYPEKRYGLEGASNGLDVTHDWSPTMTLGWGLPILMDPRLNGIPNRMGLVSPYLKDYKRELHELHYE